MSRKPRGYWTKEKCLEIAKMYSSRSLFNKEEPVAYKKCHNNGWLDEAIAHMDIEKRKPWTLKEVQKEAKKYSSRLEFAKSSSAYDYARRNGCLDDVCKHMEPIKESWTKEKVVNAAKKYSTKSDFALNESQAYFWAREYNLDEAFSHMHSAHSGFSRTRFVNSCSKKADGNGILYVATLMTDIVYIIEKGYDFNFEHFVKIGITTETAKRRLQRIKGYTLVNCSEYSFNAAEVFNLERDILTKYKKYKYNPAINFCGKTECFNVDVLSNIHSFLNRE